ncbi:carbonic anhydrase [Coprinopsis cinerea okayama7|uniref:Carbonic anhydrase n=1 Tax=Coprinopsis cinerea (strain Okayama-7 / 130 / ATCC MYA-4618 / FGSC 9003) TaxID=240176 RepID=A8NBU8_COPC7|nr:carbonic anhydrase [Coprinopsis cinerea okayama7\|eukprot:XP_001832296.2 carbonic anhydrase [Coprinopsis cinerea okayama7\
MSTELFVLIFIRRCGHQQHLGNFYLKHEVVGLAGTSGATALSKTPGASSGIHKTGVHIVGRAQSAKANESDFDILYQGNQDFRATHADSIKKLSTGQAPKFLFLGCSDSRVPEGTVFNAKPGTFFAERNIANLFEQQDNNVKAIVSYGVEHLHVKHIIVMGHYGCGGVQAAIASPPPLPWDEATTSIQTWIKPIRKLYQTSNRREIVELRERNEGEEEVAGPPTHDPGFRALVEENVKSTVSNIVRSKIIAQSS